jgi:hypothetical protein
MAAISLSISRGVSGSKLTDITIGTSAPGTADLEFRWNTTDTNSKNLTRKDLILALRAFEHLIESNPQSPAGTWLIGTGV